MRLRIKPIHTMENEALVPSVEWRPVLLGELFRKGEVARADIEHALARERRNASREEHGIASRPMPASRLDHADAAAKEAVGAGGAGPLPALKSVRRR